MRGLWIKALGFVLVASTMAFGQITFDFAGGGARAKGMGNAFLGVSDDASAISWNPAGLTAFEKPVLSVSFGSFRAKGKFDDDGLIGRQRDALNVSTKQSGSFSNINFMSFLSPLRIRGHQFVFSGAYTKVSEDYQKEDIAFSGLAPYYNQYGNLTGETYSYQLKGVSSHHSFPYAVNLGFGTRFYKNIDFGLAVNVYTGKMILRQDYVTTAPDYIPLGLQGGQTVVSERSYMQLDSMPFGGVNFTFGFRGTTPKLTYGLIVKSGYSLKRKGGSTFTDTTTYNGNIYGDLSKTVYVDNVLQKVSIPWVIGGGVGVKATENLLLDADLEYRPFSGHKIKDRDTVYIKSGGNNSEVYTTYDPQWFNVLTIRCGGEYTWKTGNRIAPVVPIRAGFNYVPIPTPNIIPSSSGSGYTTSSASRLGLSLGTGVHWSQIHLDLAYSYASMNRDVTWSLHSMMTSQIRGALPLYSGSQYGYGQVKSRDHHLDLTFTGYF